MFRSLLIGAALVAAAPAWAQKSPVINYPFLEECAIGRAKVSCDLGYEVIPSSIIFQVNILINHGIKLKPDVKGEIEFWTAFPKDRKGDCSNYTMTKRAALVALGMDRKDITIVTGRHFRDGEWYNHMVLEIEYAGNTWILDNMSDEPYKVADRKLQWEEIARYK